MVREFCCHYHFLLKCRFSIRIVHHRPHIRPDTCQFPGDFVPFGAICRIDRCNMARPFHQIEQGHIEAVGKLGVFVEEGQNGISASSSIGLPHVGQTLAGADFTNLLRTLRGTSSGRVEAAAKARSVHTSQGEKA